MSDAAALEFAADPSRVAAIAPLGGAETDPEAGAARRARFARAWSAVKGMARSAFTLENARNAGVGAATMLVVKSSACALAGACALPTVGVAASAALAGGATAAGLSYWRETRAARREGREADAFWSASNRRRMAIAGGLAILGGSTVAAYQNGMFAPLTEKLAALVEKIPLRFSFFPQAHAADFGFADKTPGESALFQPSARPAAPSAPTAPAPEAQAPKASPAPSSEPAKSSPAVKAPAAPAAAEPQRAAPAHSAKPAAAAPADTASARPAPEVKTTGGATQTPPKPSAGSALDRTHDVVKGDSRLSALAERAGQSPQGKKDLAVALLRKDPALARTLMEEAARDGNRQAIRDLAWMERHNIGGGAKPAAPAVADAAKPRTSGVAPSSPRVAPPGTVIIAPDLPPVPVAANGEAIHCHVSGDMKNRLTVDCTAPKGKNYILPGEYIGVTHDHYPNTRLEIGNAGDTPLHSWRWAARMVYEQVAVDIKNAFEKAVAWKADGGQAAEKIVQSAAKATPQWAVTHNNY